MNQPSIISLLIAALFTENFVLVKFLGCCPFLGVSKKLDTALGMGMAVTFVMAIASMFTWAVNEFVLVKFNLEYLQTIVFILIIAGLVQFVEMVVKKIMPSLYNALGIYLPLITTNCAVLGVALNAITYEFGILETVVYGLATGVGFFIAIVLLAGIRERIEYNDIPKPFQGTAIVLIASALMSIAFMGFSGMSI